MIGSANEPSPLPIDVRIRSSWTATRSATLSSVKSSVSSDSTFPPTFRRSPGANVPSPRPRSTTSRPFSLIEQRTRSVLPSRSRSAVAPQNGRPPRSKTGFGKIDTRSVDRCPEDAAAGRIVEPETVRMKRRGTTRRNTAATVPSSGMTRGARGRRMLRHSRTEESAASPAHPAPVQGCSSGGEENRSLCVARS